MAVQKLTCHNLHVQALKSAHWVSCFKLSVLTSHVQRCASGRSEDELFCFKHYVSLLCSEPVEHPDKPPKNTIQLRMHLVIEQQFVESKHLLGDLLNVSRFLETKSRKISLKHKQGLQWPFSFLDRSRDKEEEEKKDRKVPSRQDEGKSLFV